ncbi:MAG: YitT family protein [Alphaproteobacteria bacterium]|nr:YitT family protein [Alphaproteobacteria bacterium]
MKFLTTKKPFFKKLATFLFALYLCGTGIAFATRAQLGTTAISSLPFVFTFFTPLSFGTMTFLINMLFLIGQYLILKKEFTKDRLYQIPITLCFGFFIDLGMAVSSRFAFHSYIDRLIMLVIGSAIMAVGICLELKSRIAYIPGDGFVEAVFQKTKYSFGSLKMAFDISLCVSACLLSLIVLRSVQGIREGTVISAVLVGFFVNVLNRIFQKFSSVQEKRLSS